MQISKEICTYLVQVPHLPKLATGQDWVQVPHLPKLATGQEGVQVPHLPKLATGTENGRHARCRPFLNHFEPALALLSNAITLG